MTIRPPARKLRLGVMLHETSEFIPLLGIHASADGGLIFFPGDYISAASWRYGVSRFTIHGTGGSLATTLQDSIVEAEIAPKLHYHRSGVVSVDATGRLPKRSTRCLWIPRAQGEQCFSYVVLRPDLLSPAPAREGDFFPVAHDAWPNEVVVFGFLYPRAMIPNIDEGVDSDQRALTLLPGYPDVAIDLRGHGLDSCLTVRFWTRRNQLLDQRAKVAASLWGLDGRGATRDAIADFVGMWTDSFGLPAVPVCAVSDLPFKVADSEGRTYSAVERRIGPR